MGSWRSAWLCGALAGCVVVEGAQDTDPDRDAPPGLIDTDDRCALTTWRTVGGPFLATWCGPCHGTAVLPADRQGAPEGVVLDTEDDAHRWADRIVVRALGDAPTMPPVGAPDADTRAQMAAYLACLAGEDDSVPSGR